MKQPTIKYVLSPGWVRSASDGQSHYISAPRLAQLYGVKLADCIVANEECSFYEQLSGLRHVALVSLGPKSNGDYSLPTISAEALNSAALELAKHGAW